MLKFPSSKNKKGLPNTRVKTTSSAELSPFEFKRRSKKISFDTCLALKTDYFGLQNGWTAHLTVCGGSGHVFISFGTLGSLQWHWHWTSAVQHWDDIYCIYIMYWCGMYIYFICRCLWLCEIKYVHYIIYIHHCTQIYLHILLVGYLGTMMVAKLAFPPYVGLKILGFNPQPLKFKRDDTLERVAPFKISIFWVTLYRCV